MTEHKPFLHVLNASWGQQSTALVEMLLRGEIERPLRIVIVTADPGMENTTSYGFNREYRKRCWKDGIDIITAQGPSLYNDLVSLPSTGSRRLDSPPFWTKDENGKRGCLIQKCTQFYKIAPMDRAIRKYLQQKYGIRGGKALRPGLVEKWIGFTADEWHRCSESDVAYITFKYPLIEMGLTKDSVREYFLQQGMTAPDRSLCSACPFHNLISFKKMYEERPENWAQAVEVDNSLESWPRLGITTHECFVSSSLVRLRDLPAINFGIDDPDMSEHHCNSGHCFL